MSTLNQGFAGYALPRGLLSSSYFWLSLMVLLWGVSWPVTRLALDAVPPLWLATIRFASSAICLFSYLALRGQLKLPAREDLPIVLSTGLLQMMTFTGLGMMAMVHIDTGRAVLLAYTTPLWCVLAGWILFRDLPTRLQLIALLTGLAGIAVICSPVELDWSQPGTLLGAAFLLLGALSWAVVILHVRRHRWQGSPLALAPWQMLLATGPLAVAAACREGSPAAISFSVELIQLLVFIGPVATSACFVISAEHGRRISTFAMSNFTLGVPLVGIVISQWGFGFDLSALFLLGLGLIVAGVSLAALAVGRAGQGLRLTPALAGRFRPGIQRVRAAAQVSMLSPLPRAGSTRPFTIKVGDTWMPFWRAYLQCHLISCSSAGMAKASARATPLWASRRAISCLGVTSRFGPVQCCSNSNASR